MNGRIVVFVLFVLAATGVFLWQAHLYPFRPPWQRAVTQDSLPQAQVAATLPAQVKKSSAAHSLNRATAGSPARAVFPAVVVATSTSADVPPAEAAPAPVAEAAAVPPVVDPLPFPVVQQIAAGEAEDEVREKYGDPALSSLTSQDGHVERTFVYHRNRGYTETIIRLEDGKVAAAYSRSMPPPPAGLSTPRPLPADKN